jgi:hypothetical protein
MEIIQTNFTYLKPLIPLDKNLVKTIVIHHAEAFIADPETIHKWHLEKGWNGAGYNYYVRKDGSVYEMRGFHIGAQCEGWNSKSIGICVEGNWEIDSEIPDKMMVALIDTINYVRRLLPNPVMIEPHMKFYPTLCPGRFMYNAMTNIRECADAFMGVDALAAQGVFTTTDYWKRVLWLKLNPNSDYFRCAMLNAGRMNTTP